MDQQKLWENNLKTNSNLENTIAVIGFKAALLIGKTRCFINAIKKTEGSI